jgi:hypothetical protein
MGFLLALPIVFGENAQAKGLSQQTASSQAVRQTVVVTEPAPVFVTPNEKQTPLRVASAGSVLLFLNSEGDWYHVEFNDPDVGRRVGYVQKRFARFVEPDSPPAPKTTGGSTRSRAANQTTIHEQPRGDSRVVATVQAGTAVDVLEQRGDWYRVSLILVGQNVSERNSVTGWVHRTGLERMPAEAESPRAQSPAPPQTTAQANVPKANVQSRTPIGVRAYFAGDINAMAAQNSFQAIVGSSTLMGLGGGVDVLRVWKDLFIRGAVTHTSKDGSRAFVFDGQAISLNIPMKVSMTPIETGGGWRFPSPRVTPYAGGAAIFAHYSETSTFAGSGDNVSETKVGYSGFGGVDFTLSKWVMAGVEAQYRSVPNAIGTGGVSQDFGETNLGGFSVRVMFGIKH